MKTQQEIFDIVSIHLLTQNSKSSNFDSEAGDYECLYRGPEGKKCAVGILIPDSLYAPELEGTAAASLCTGHFAIWEKQRELVYKLRKEIPEFCEENDSLLANLQFIHDKVPVENWEKELVMLAARYDLNCYKLDEFFRQKEQKIDKTI